MKQETILEKAKAESRQFGNYAEYMLSEFPNMNMPTLRDCFNHNASAGEYRRHMERVKREAKK